MNALNKIVLRTAVSGLVWVTVVFCYGLGIFAMAFPGTMAKFYDAAGDKKLSALYHERIYKRNPTNENLYRALDKFIAAGNTKKIVKYGEKMFEIWQTDAVEYYKIIDAVDEYKIASAGVDLMVLMFACNEDDRLRRAYIGALLATGRQSEAIIQFENAVNLSNLRLLSPSFAIFEFGPTADVALVDKFFAYHAEYVTKYDIEPLDLPKVKYFYDHGREMFENLVSGAE